MKQKNDLKQQLNDFGKALKELNTVHYEMSKSKTEIKAVINTLQSIEIYLIDIDLK